MRKFVLIEIMAMVIIIHSSGPSIWLKQLWNCQRTGAKCVRKRRERVLLRHLGRQPNSSTLTHAAAAIAASDIRFINLLSVYSRGELPSERSLFSADLRAHLGRFLCVSLQPASQNWPTGKTVNV